MKALRGRRAWLSVVLLASFCARQAAAQTQPLVLTNLVVDSNSATIIWSGGSGPYLVQRKSSLSDAAWLNVAATTESYAVIPRDSDAAFYQLQDGTTNTNTVAAFSAGLTGTAERPTPLTNSASGFATFFRDGSNLTYNISYSGLSGSAGAIFIQGPANANQSAGSVVTIGPISATSATLSGRVTLSPLQLSYLNTGSLCLNFLTTANPHGEIRGQLAPVMYSASLSGTNEVPSVTTGGSGTGQFNLVGNELWYDVVYSNLTSGATTANLTQTNTVLETLAVPGGTSGRLTGKLMLTQPELDTLLDHLDNLNICTVSNSAGEIRGLILHGGLSTGVGGGGGG